MRIRRKITGKIRGLILETITSKELSNNRILELILFAPFATKNKMANQVFDLVSRKVNDQIEQCETH
jgi:hypothetical protein